ncbi:hypothetical protein HanRHA438_Chr08g0372641 [Helianthus annuus]|nr:hypothetical protein HanRHA438_Chr08g0372641 [Helianthus annuus]
MPVAAFFAIARSGYKQMKHERKKNAAKKDDGTPMLIVVSNKWINLMMVRIFGE